MPDPVVDRQRWVERAQWRTGIYVRAKDANGNWDSVDIDVLTKESLLDWLHSREACNPWAENVVGILLRHGNLHGAA